MKAPRIYAAISAISRELAKTGIAKSSVNTDVGYSFRSVDEVMCALAPLLAKHRVCILPRLSERWSQELAARAGLHVTVKGRFDLVAASDGSTHTLESFGEAIDTSDKATSKAMTAAYKYALIQAFCIPIRGTADADESSPRRISPFAEPVQGWIAWSQDVIALVSGCETVEAIDRIAATYADQLRQLAIAKRPEYAEIGQAIRDRRTALTRAATATSPSQAEPVQNVSATHAA